MATYTSLTTATGNPIFVGSDETFQVTVEGSGDLEGTYEGTLRGNGFAIPLAATVSDPVARVLDCTLADTDTATLAAGFCEFDIWRTDAGSAYPVVYGLAELVRTARTAT